MTPFLTSRRSFAHGILIAALVCGVSIAQAQTSAENKAVAEALFREGKTLMDGGRVAEGCRKLEESYRLDPAQGTLLNLAVCHEKEGKIATAWGEFSEAFSTARKEGRLEREQLAREHIDALQPHVPKLKILVSPEVRVAGMEVLRNGTPLGSGAWNSSIPVDPGDVLIEVKAPNYKPWKTTIRVERGNTKAEIKVPALEAAPVAPPVASSGAPLQPKPPEEFWDTRHTAGAVVGGVGVVALGVGTYFGLNALSLRSKSTDICTQADGSLRCTQDGYDKNESARKNALLADFTLGFGAAAAITSVILLATDWGQSSESAAPASAQAKPRLNVSFSATPSMAGAGVYGSW